ncbi:glycosyltransferase, group 2 family protein [Leptospira yanagawae serovar Saopaulo str. Sao Paulo = ATCC 700523]|uniref:Glycosyltransferase, group 2 family protein n=1 Tax=Leptospira yanagawae serovar Saopaulo str. Sao Paulo = ATCC 700523 TaxID=1249483 RepID=A0A5E8HBL0_9LEPT|nr:glycosyltransferase family 2 protein [Leptospira yanagawae]EOQ88157.1 glycosyltransferase, group 2 family protein [Leptospira yanagawae serovar Saopaulo str. Sao Paulo = ATCC 700523]
MNEMKLSVVIPAYNEEENIQLTLTEIVQALEKEKIPYEIVIVNDNSKDRTPDIVANLAKENPAIKLINRTPPGGFGRAIRTGLEYFSGDVVVIVMADLSDDPLDIVKYYRKIEEGYDCVYGSRFTKKSIVKDYPTYKLIINRIVNKLIQLIFVTKHNDLTNAFKAYRAHVIESIQPLYACHFNITIELSLSALIRRYKIGSVPINWYGRKWGQSNLKLRAMGRRYLATLIKIWFERILILDDVLAEKSITKPE